jgi:uncharacterized membrane protein
MNQSNARQTRRRLEPGLQEHTFPPNRRVEDPDINGLQRWLSGIGGALFLWHGLKQKGINRWPLLIGGAGLLYLGISARNILQRIPAIQNLPGVGEMVSGPPQLRIRRSLTISRPAAELYSYWRNLGNLPAFMHHIKSVEETEGGRSHWVVRVLRDRELEWDAQITVERPNEMIGWETLPEADIHNRGYVKFIETPHGTEVSVSLEYTPPGAALGRLAGRAVKFIAAHQIKEEIRNFKRLMEAGELPTTKGQPAARESAWRQSRRIQDHQPPTVAQLQRSVDGKNQTNELEQESANPRTQQEMKTRDNETSRSQPTESRSTESHPTEVSTADTPMSGKENRT